jgi:hypothetical protein
MLVYGDPSFEEPAATTLIRVRAWAEQAGGKEQDDRRRLLIEAGQLEQALADRLGNDPLVQRIMTVTELAADAFLGYADLGPIQKALAEIELPPDLTVRVKVPEGFAFYALYPEQYAEAARRWLRDHAVSGSKRAAVVGIRSVGTGLSAVVARVLAKAGWRVRRLTVRPTGHPYARRAELPSEAVRGAVFGLVMDEGPGLSGSSMAAAAHALVEAGIDRSKVVFFPGHDRGPGHAGNEDVRRWWADTPRYVVGLNEMTRNGRSLADELAYRSGPFVRVDDLSGGMWRRAVYASEDEWPAAFAAFERTKYRVVRRDGSSVLWKFEGLTGAAEAGRDRMAWLARRGWTAAPLDAVHGFVARPWIEGKPLRRESRDPAILARIGRYIAEAAMPPGEESERCAALERLRDMLYWNTLESLGEAMAERTREWSGSAPESPGPTYGDGRLGPQEWLLGPGGRLLKVDCVGHGTDHTLIGPQPVAWDLAGAIVEWGLGGEDARILLKAFSSAGGKPPPLSELRFYRLAYAAFRLGQCALCATRADSADRRRLEREAGFYRARLAHGLVRGSCEEVLRQALDER